MTNYGKLVNGKFRRMPVAHMEGTTLVASTGASAAAWRAANGWLPIEDNKPTATYGYVVKCTGYAYDSATTPTKVVVQYQVVPMSGGSASEVRDTITETDATTMTFSEKDKLLTKIATAIKAVSLAVVAMFAVSAEAVDSQYLGNLRTTDLVVTAVPDKAMWNREGIWSLDYELLTAPAVQTNIIDCVTNDYGQINIEEMREFSYTFSARLSPTLLDTRVVGYFPIVSYSVGGGAAISNDVVSVTTGGMYRVVGVDQRGWSTYADIPFTAGIGACQTSTYYVADRPGSIRKAVNDTALGYITNAVMTGTGTYEGKTYQKWNYFTQPDWALTSSGSACSWKPFVIGTKCMASANHYSHRPTGAQVVGGITVTKGNWVSLYDWAVTNGWTEAEAREMGLGDIALIPLTAGEIPTNSLPWIMTEQTYRSRFGGDEGDFGGLTGVSAWTATQAFSEPFAVCLFNPSKDRTRWYWSSYVRYARPDIGEAITAQDPRYIPHSGDSGHPVYFRDGDKWTLISHYHTTSTGPNYTTALPVIRAFNASIGSTILEY